MIGGCKDLSKKRADSLNQKRVAVLHSILPSEALKDSFKKSMRYIIIYKLEIINIASVSTNGIFTYIYHIN